MSHGSPLTGSDRRPRVVHNNAVARASSRATIRRRRRAVSALSDVRYSFDVLVAAEQLAQQLVCEQLPQAVGLSMRPSQVGPPPWDDDSTGSAVTTGSADTGAAVTTGAARSAGAGAALGADRLDHRGGSRSRAKRGVSGIAVAFTSGFPVAVEVSSMLVVVTAAPPPSPGGAAPVPLLLADVSSPQARTR